MLVLVLQWQANVSLHQFASLTCQQGNMPNIIISILPTFPQEQMWTNLFQSGQCHFLPSVKWDVKSRQHAIHLVLSLEGAKEVRVKLCIFLSDLPELGPAVFVALWPSWVSGQIPSVSLRFGVWFRSVDRDTGMPSSFSFWSSSCASMMGGYPWTTRPFLLTPDWKTYAKWFTGITSD